jgi:hypothetical protein
MKKTWSFIVLVFGPEQLTKAQKDNRADWQTWSGI